jgi:3D (Asp-Asp-Asp) domain-containing protein
MQYRTVEREWIEEVPIPPAVRTRKTSMMQKGWEIVLQPGRPGAYVALVRARYKGARRIARWEVETRVSRAARAEERLAGASARQNPVNAPQLTRVARFLKVLATAYDAGPLSNTWEYAGTTRLGWRTRRGIVAVDPRVIPLRSLLFVEGYGLAWAGDVGGAIKGMRVDLCFNRTDEALNWGRRQTYVYVLQELRGKKQARSAIQSTAAPATRQAEGNQSRDVTTTQSGRRLL